MLNFFPVVLGLVLPASAADPRVDPVVSPITRYHLRVTTVAGEALPAAGWTLTQPDGAAVRAVDVRLRTRAASLTPEGWPYPSTPEHVAIVAFDAPWASSSGSYMLSDGVEQWSFDWDPALNLAPSIHLNPYGGRPDAPDLLALVSTWNVDGPAITLSEQDAWSVVDDATGSEVRAGVWTLREPATTTVDDAYGNSFTRANVYQADLAGLPAGSYHLVWDDVGRSYSFRVADDAWDLPFRTVLGGLLNQRCGIALPPELTDWPRPACHRAAVERTTADYRVVGEDAFDALPAAATGEFVDAPGGYHDAGDYDRNIGHLAVVHAMTELYASDPARFAHDALGLPESGNGLPDVLDEAIWAMGPWTALQADDGGVPGGIGTTAYPAYDAMPEDDVGACTRPLRMRRAATSTPRPGLRSHGRSRLRDRARTPQRGSIGPSARGLGPRRTLRVTTTPPSPPRTPPPSCCGPPGTRPGSTPTAPSGRSRTTSPGATRPGTRPCGTTACGRSPTPPLPLRTCKRLRDG